MAVPFGLSTTLYITLTDGQSVTILYGWVFISLVSLAIAASLAEICAVYPTAGGVSVSRIYTGGDIALKQSRYTIGVPCWRLGNGHPSHLGSLAG